MGVGGDALGTQRIDASTAIVELALAWTTGLLAASYRFDIRCTMYYVRCTMYLYRTIAAVITSSSYGVHDVPIRCTMYMYIHTV